jgi:hypothetical protein
MQVMLSVPLPSLSGEWMSLQMIWSNMSSTTLEFYCGAFLAFMLFASKSTHCCEDKQSQMPSQAITRNLSSLVNSTFFISGTQVII